MRNLVTLVLMQLKEKLKLKNHKYNDKKFLFQIIYGVLKFALVVALCFVLLFVANFLQLFSLTNFIPSTVITVIFTVMMVVSIISCTVQLTKSMYFSLDNAVLLTLPCRPTQVYLSKLIIFYIFELKRNLSFMIPLFIAYFILFDFSFIFYPWLFFCYIFISMIPVLIGAILSIPGMWIYNFFRQYKRVQTGLLVVLVGLVTFAVIKLISLIPENIDLIGTWGTTFWEIQDFLNWFSAKFVVVNKLVGMLVGARVNLVSRLIFSTISIRFIILLAVNIAIFVVGIFTTRPLFYKMASKPFEYLKKPTKPKKNRPVSKKLSIIKNELLLNFRSPEKIFANFGLLIGLPILIFFLNKMYAAMNTRDLGDSLVVCFNILIILLVALSSNSYAASVFSRDGRSSYLIKVQPSDYKPLITAKLLFNTIFMVLSLTATLVVLIYTTKFGVVKSLLIYLIVLFIYFAHLFYSAEFDIMNPQTELYSTIGQNDNNPNETKSTMLAFLISFILFGVMLFLLIEENTLVPFIKVAAVLFILMIFRIYMFYKKVTLYYKER